MTNLTLSCHCNTIQGVVRSVTPKMSNRLVCYCHDCRAFANHLQSKVPILDEYGGTEIMQTPPAAMEITQGHEQVACLRFSDKGLYRWYAACCQTPIGNTVGLNLPIVGLIHGFISPGQDLDEMFGREAGCVYPKQALAEVPAEMMTGGSHLATTLKMVRKLLLWKILGKSKPSPFFDDQGKPVVEPIIVSSDQRKQH